MGNSRVFDWIDYTLATIELLALFGIIAFMGLMIYRDYKRFDNKNYYK